MIHTPEQSQKYFEILKREFEVEDVSWHNNTADSVTFPAVPNVELFFPNPEGEGPATFYFYFDDGTEKWANTIDEVIAYLKTLI